MIGFTADGGAFFILFAAAVVLQQASIGVGYMIGVLLHSLVVSAAFSTLVEVLFATGGGVIIPPATIDESRWLHIVEFLSPTRQGMVIMLNNELSRRPGGIDLSRNVLDYKRRWDETDVLWPMLIGLCLVFRIGAALLFKYTTRAPSY